MGVAIVVLAGLLLAACSSIPSGSIGLASEPGRSGSVPSAAPTATAGSPQPTAPFDVLCGPLDATACQGAVGALEAVGMPAAEGAITAIRLEPDAALSTCPASGTVCAITAAVTFASSDTIAYGLVRSGAGWSWQGQRSGWWGGEQAISCQPPATYRLGSRIEAIGSCLGLLVEPAAVTITIPVGTSLDLHMYAGGPHDRPEYPLPWSTSPGVLAIAAASDAAAATYVAASPGATTLMTYGNCVPRTKGGTGLGPEFAGLCPLAEVTVVAAR